MKIAYVTDSSACENKEYFTQNGIFSVPLQVEIQGKNYLDLEEVQPQDIAEALQQEKTISTSLPSLGLIDELFQNLKAQHYEKVVAVVITSGLSGTLNAFRLAAENNDLAFTFIDTFTTAYFQKNVIEYLKEAGHDDTILQKRLTHVQEIVNSPATNTIVIPKNLKQMKKSGRLSTTAYHVAEMLGIKPILGLNFRTAGKVEVYQKVRTFHKALDTLLSIMKENISIDIPYHIYITHVANETDATACAEKCHSLFPRAHIEVLPLCAPVAVHVGIGGICVQYYPSLT